MEGFYFFLVFAHELATFERLAMVEPPIVARCFRFALRLGKPAGKYGRIAEASTVGELISDTR